MRPVIALLLLVPALAGGCDRQSEGSQQANQSATTNAAGEPANETLVEETIGTLDRSHKGEAAPTIPFDDPSGAKVTLASFKGKPLLLNLWATWCAPCVKEMPSLDALAGQLDGKVRVLVLSQDMADDKAEARPKVEAFFKKANLTRLQPYLEDESKFTFSLGVNLPTTILYDSGGKEVWRMSGGMDWTGETAKELIAEAS